MLSNLNNFHSLEVVDRVSETQLQVGENSNRIIWRLKGVVLLVASDDELSQQTRDTKTVGSMWGRCLRCWPDIESTMYQRLVSDGLRSA